MRLPSRAWGSIRRGPSGRSRPRSAGAVLSGLLACLVAVGAAAPGRAGVIITPQADVNGKLQFTWSGSLNLAGATLAGQVGGMALLVAPQIGILHMASTSAFNNQWSLVDAGPGAFGTGEFFQIDYNTTGSSDGNATFAVFDTITLPDGYAGEALFGTVTFADVAYAAVGLTPGTYTWTLSGSGDTVVMTVPGGGVPEIDPAGMGSVLALVTGALGLLERRRRKKA